MSGTSLRPHQRRAGPARCWLVGAALALAVAAALWTTAPVAPTAEPAGAAPAKARPSPALVSEGEASEAVFDYAGRVGGGATSAPDDEVMVQGPFGYEAVGRGAGAVSWVRGPAPARVRLADASSGDPLLFGGTGDDYDAEGPQSHERRPRR